MRLQGPSFRHCSKGFLMHRRIVGLCLAVLLTMTLAAPAAAIVYGQQDTTNRFSNVGAMVVEFEGDLFGVCTGTLIRADIVLTAAHCLFGDRMAVTFDPVLEDDLADNELHWGDAIGHENFFCCGASNTFDIAVILLDDPVTGITPAPLATANQLGNMTAQQLKRATFETAGYGAVRENRQTAHQELFSDPHRRWATQTANSLTQAWFTLSMNQATGNGGTCFGDSGGPHFLNGAIVSLTVTGDRWCKSTDKTYRVDTPVAREFLGRFMTLP